MSNGNWNTRLLEFSQHLSILVELLLRIVPLRIVSTSEVGPDGLELDLFGRISSFRPTLKPHPVVVPNVPCRCLP